MKKKQQKNKSQIITVLALTMFGLALILSVVGLSQTVINVKQEQMAREPEAVLASVGVESGADISLPVSYYDQRSDACVNMYDSGMSEALNARQFEWASCGYTNKQIEQGLVDYELDENYLPVAVGGELLPNRGLTDMTRWFDNVEGKSKEYTGTLKLVYKQGETVEFSYVDGDFYPLDAVAFSEGDSVNKDGHNHLFTMSVAVPFTVMASGDESLAITADDDTFVYVGNELALDMGGIHEATTGRLMINEAGEVYTGVMGEDLAYSGVKLSKDEGSIIRIFHADRDSDESVFKVRLTGMSLNIVQTQLASGSGVQVAYDPSNPGYVGPLGESSVFRPDGSKGYIIMATVLGVAIMTCAMFTAILAHTLIKNKRQR
ncbi:hypothetical protein IJH01_00050 [Candidatus Saccharibacteria bacterium]|nr:hypothetical protein [Candidatus Saccharibacteria bacterium]